PTGATRIATTRVAISDRKSHLLCRCMAKTISAGAPSSKPLDPPGPGAQLDRSASRRGEARLEVPPNSFLYVDTDRGQIARRGARPTEERLPVVVKVLEDGWNIDGANRHGLQSYLLKQSLERPGLAKWEPLGLVELGITWAHRYGRVPEVPHHVHSAGIVPHIRRHASARLRHPGHFSRHGLVVAHEVQDQPGHGHIMDARLPRQGFRIPGFEVDPRVSDACPCVGHEALRRVDTVDRRRCTCIHDGGG